MTGEIVHEGHNGAAALDESPPKVHIGDVGELVVGDVQQTGQLQPVGAGLVEHDQEFTVGQHGPGRVGLEQIVHILGQAGAAGTILSNPLPKGEQKVGAVLMLEQQIDFIDIDPGIPPQAAVAGDSVEKAVQDHQHAHGEQLFAQLPDIIAGDAGAHVHIGGFGKGVETALRKQFQCQSHVPRLGLRLAQQFRVEVLERGGLALAAVPHIVVVALCRTAVDDGLFLGRQLSGPHRLFTERKQELRFQHHGVFPFAVALLHVHGVDVVAGGGRDLHHLAAQPLH